MKEIWKDIEGYEGLYQVSNLGRVKSLPRKVVGLNNVIQNFKGKILKQHKDKKGYLRVALSKNNKIKLKQVHRLVAEAFIPNPENKPTVNHKFGIKSDNRVSQLEWNSYREQIKNAINIGLIDYSKLNYKEINKKVISKTRKPICQYDLNGNFIKQYVGVNEAQRQTGIYNISKCLTGKKSNVCGFIWKYKKEVVGNDL